MDYFGTNSSIETIGGNDANDDINAYDEGYFSTQPDTDKRGHLWFKDLEKTGQEGVIPLAVDMVGI